MASAEQLKEQQKKQWSSTALSWERRDAWLEAQTQPLTDWLCDGIELRQGMHVLDLACGSGQPAITAARRVQPSGRVTATDISADMVAVARRAADRAQVENIEVRVMDAEAIEFADDSFDAVTMRFGLMFCPDPVKAASEIRRVLRPGGRFAIAVWDVPAKNPFFTAVTGPLAQIGAAPPQEPQAPGPFRLAAPGELRSVLASAGFSEFDITSLPLTFEYASPDEYWAMQTELAAPVKAAVDTLPEADVARLKEAVLAGLQGYVQGGRVRLLATPLCAAGHT